MKTLKLVTFNKYEVIPYIQKPSEDHALSYVLPLGKHDPALVSEIDVMIGKMLENAIQQVPSGTRNYVCNTNQPRLPTSDLIMSMAHADRCAESRINPIRYYEPIGAAVWGNYTRFPSRKEPIYPVVTGVIELDPYDLSNSVVCEIESLNISEALVVFNLLRLNEVLTPGLPISKETEHFFHEHTSGICQQLMAVNLVSTATVYKADPTPFSLSIVVQFHPWVTKYNEIKIDIGTQESVNILNRMKNLFLV